MDIVCEQEILVITYLFPDPKYDILITSSTQHTPELEDEGDEFPF